MKFSLMFDQPFRKTMVYDKENNLLGWIEAHPATEAGGPRSVGFYPEFACADDGDREQPLLSIEQMRQIVSEMRSEQR